MGGDEGGGGEAALSFSRARSRATRLGGDAAYVFRRSTTTGGDERATGGSRIACDVSSGLARRLPHESRSRMRGGCRDDRWGSTATISERSRDWQCSWCSARIHTRARARAHMHTRCTHTHTLLPCLSFLFFHRTDGWTTGSVDVGLPVCVTVYYRHLASRRRPRVVRSTRVVNVNAMTVCVSFFRFLASRPPRATTVTVSGTHARTHARSSRRVFSFARAPLAREPRALASGSGGGEHGWGEPREPSGVARVSSVLPDSCCCASARLSRGSILFIILSLPRARIDAGVISLDYYFRKM